MNEKRKAKHRLQIDSDFKHVCIDCCEYGGGNAQFAITYHTDLPEARYQLFAKYVGSGISVFSIEFEEFKTKNINLSCHYCQTSFITIAEVELAIAIARLSGLDGVINYFQSIGL